MSDKFSFGARIRSFKFAFGGIWMILKTQHNCWIHFAATVIVVGMGFLFRVSFQEWCLLVIAIMMVWVAEAFNTALEFLADAVSPELCPLIKNTKDVAAGAVLIAAIASVIIGLLVFIPYF
jgi:diacylglycerol kinase (ATP)